MPIDPRIALGYQPPHQESPMNVMAQMQALQNARQENAMRQAQMENYASEVARRNALLPVEMQEARAKVAKEEAARKKGEHELSIAELDRQMDHVALVNNQAGWTAWRNGVVAKDPSYAAYIPEEFTPENKVSALSTGKFARDQIAKDLETTNVSLGGTTEGITRTGKTMWTRKETASPNKPAGTTINVGTGKEFGKKMGEKAAEQLDTAFTQAQSAQTSLETSARLAPLLSDKNFISGTLGDARLTVAKALGLKGADETQAFFSGMGQQVAERIKAFGSGTALSDADRKYAEKMAGGSIELTPDAIKKIVRLNDQYAQSVIDKYHQRRSFLSKTDPEVENYYPAVGRPAAPTATGQRKTASGAVSTDSGWQDL
jgi:hypothetical protein